MDSFYMILWSLSRSCEAAEGFSRSFVFSL
nr:MAG TPA: hypothetical protein [Caudoviricetes sp.]